MQGAKRSVPLLSEASPISLFGRNVPKRPIIVWLLELPTFAHIEPSSC